MDELATIGNELDIAFLGLGMQPMSTLDEIEWVPKQRYGIMRDYMTRVGTLGQRMMKQTATVQANIDYRRRGRRHAQASDRHGDGAAGERHLRQLVHLREAAERPDELPRPHLDRHRSARAAGCCRSRSAPARRFDDYVAWALDVPLYFVLRGGRYRTEVTGVPFRRFLDTGLDGQPATLDDWRLHLTTLFPEVRLKGYIELRSADSQPPGTRPRRCRRW